MFIVCGVLYAIDSVVERYTDIRLALDLYTSKILDVKDLKFTNPFSNTTTVGYNHRNKVFLLVKEKVCSRLVIKCTGKIILYAGVVYLR